jgi:hypothetical protein
MSTSGAQLNQPGTVPATPEKQPETANSTPATPVAQEEKTDTAATPVQQQ